MASTHTISAAWPHAPENAQIASGPKRPCPSPLPTCGKANLRRVQTGHVPVVPVSAQLKVAVARAAAREARQCVQGEQNIDTKSVKGIAALAKTWSSQSWPQSIEMTLALAALLI